MDRFPADELGNGFEEGIVQRPGSFAAVGLFDQPAQHRVTDHRRSIGEAGVGPSVAADVHQLVEQ